MVIVPAETEQSHLASGARGPRLLLIDPHPLILAALRELLTGPPLCADVDVASTTEEIDARLASGEFELVLCDWRAAPVTALELAERLSAGAAAIPMILLGEVEDEALLLRSLDSPISGVFTKDASLDEFLVGIRAVLAGNRVVGRRIMAALIARAGDGQRSTVAGPASQLSPTELEILAMVGRADSVATIAVARGISHKTVRNHLTNICRKLQLRGRSEAMIYAARAGLAGPTGAVEA